MGGKLTRNIAYSTRFAANSRDGTLPEGGGGVLPYMGYIGMCRCEGYGFQAVYSRIGYINQKTDQLVEDFI